MMVSIAGTAATTHGAILVHAPGEHPSLLNESVVMFFDPLAQRQTTLVRFEVDNTRGKIGLLLPLPRDAEVFAGDERLFDLVSRRQRQRVHRERRIRIKLTSWLVEAMIEDIGISTVRPKKMDRPPRAAVKHGALGMTSNSISAWLIEHGFTLSAAQFAWLRHLRTSGYGIYGMVLSPAGDVSKRWTPPLTMVHDATIPSYPARHVPFALADDDTSLATPLNVVAISEWPLTLDAVKRDEPFLIEQLSSTVVQDMVRSTRSHRLTYRRGGYLTAFKGPRSPQSRIYTFSRAENLRTRRPKPITEHINVDVPLPIEAGLGTVVLLIWGWRSSRAHRRIKMQRLS
ncbi:MAG: hypothetical protein VX589_20725 [Myxococcota bacterium]|nr:hypothetical protein [Myxococcota bacterium]